MIHSLSVKNFYSIKGEITANFVAKRNSITAPELYLNAPFGKKVTKIAFVGGANGSGKTNILRALTFIGYMITSPDMTTRGEIPYLPFAMKLGAPSELKVSFSVREHLYDYCLKFNHEMIVAESLWVTRLVSARTSRKMIYRRIWNEDEYEVEISDLAKDLRNVKNIDRSLATDSGKTRTIVEMYSDIDAVDGTLREVKDFWRKLSSNVVSLGNMESEFATSKLANDALRFFYEQNNENSYGSRLLRSADIGFDGIGSVKDPQSPNSPWFGIRHRYNDTSFMLSTVGESSGTNRIVYLVGEIAKALSWEDGGIAIIDDMDAFVHPDVYEMLVEQFMSPYSNKNGVQLIMSSHNYTTLNFLDKQQIFLTERNDEGATELWRLDEVRGVEAHDNFYAKYMAGKYGAVPRVEGV